MGSEVVFEPFLESPVDAWPQSQVGHYLRFNYTIISPRNKVMLSKLQKQLKLWKKSCIDKIFDNFIYYLDIQLYTKYIISMFYIYHVYITSWFGKELFHNGCCSVPFLTNRYTLWKMAFNWLYTKTSQQTIFIFCIRVVILASHFVKLFNIYALKII